MRVLVLGGSVFLGRHVVEAALARGHEVTLFNRGRTEPELFPAVEHRIGDRDGGLEALAVGSWDVVIDTSGYVPRVVSASAQLLEPRVGRYVFVSSVSVYADLSRPGVEEDAPVASLEEETEEHRGPAYGALKALSEAAVQELFGPRATVVRPGLIVGPWDPTGRFTYWPARVAVGGDVLAPEPRTAPVQLIDVRDLAAWIVHLVEADMQGVFNAVGPERPLTMEEVLETCCAVAGGDSRLVWAPASWLVDQGVQEWMELPLWISSPEYAGLSAISVERALATGLRFRSLAETAADTLAWVRARKASAETPAGLDPQRERALLVSLVSPNG
jgi:2'-hydroxyisoflavone reductase